MSRLGDGGWSAPRHVEEFRWSVDLGAQQVHDLVTTSSDWSPAEVEEATAAVAELGGRVTERCVSPLAVLRRPTRT